MIAARIFPSPGAIRPAISAAAASASKAAISVVDALAKLLQRLKDVLRVLFGGSDKHAVAVSDADADAIADATNGDDSLAEKGDSDDDSDSDDDDESYEDDDGNDDPVWRMVRFIIALEATDDEVARRPPVQKIFQSIRARLEKPLATDALATQYFDAIREDPKYTALSRTDQHAAMALVNHLHRKHGRYAFDLDYDGAIVDVVVGALRTYHQCSSFAVEKACIALSRSWWCRYGVLCLATVSSWTKKGAPFPYELRSAVTTYFDQ